MTGIADRITRDMAEKSLRGLLAGFVATVLLTMMMYFGAPMMIGKPMDIAAHLGAMMGGAWTAGMIVHFILGTVLFPIGFLVLVYRRIAGAAWLKGVVWGITLWLAAMVVVMPLTGGGLFMGAMPSAVASLAGHIVYGAVLGAIIGQPRSAGRWS
jgi:uncharacterized membrane protein YagU involved in acid resistance